MKEVKMGMGRKRVRFRENGIVEITWPLYANDLVLCGEPEEDVMGWLAEVCSRKGLKVSAGNGARCSAR